MECPNCEKEIKSEVVAEIQIIEDVERVCLFLTCEHCNEKLYGAVKTTIFESI